MRKIVAHARRAGLAAGLLAAAVPAPAAPPPVSVIVAEARLDRIEDRVEALGTLRANESVALTATITETVSRIHFDDGDRVPAGRVLVEMTSAEEHAQLAEAAATVAEARRQYERVRSLESQGTAAVSLLDERRRQWETARARLTAIESRLDDRLIKAPFAGVVGLRDLSVGALVEPGDLITTLDDDTVMKLEFPVPATFVPALRPGLPVVATSRAYGAREFRGEVSAVASRVDPVTRAVTVRALIPNERRELKPGMLMQVDLLLRPRQSVVIPEEAITQEARDHFVLVVDSGGKAQRRQVRIGTRRPGEVEVVEGLAPGETVITQGGLKVRPGQAVTVRAVDDGSRPLGELLGAAPAVGAAP